MDKADGLELMLRVLGGESINTATDEMGRNRQKAFVEACKESCQFPKVGSCDSEESKAQFESLGFKFGKEIDKMFIEATLPEGWSIKPTDHYMWSTLLDEKGRERGSIFFKPDFWDRSAFVRLRQRYTAESKIDHNWLNEHRNEYEDSSDAYNDTLFSALVRDYDETVLWQHGPVIPRKLGVDWRTGNNGYGLDSELKALAVKWLEEHYPNYEDPTAYWND
jgi:hypothetical protein